MEDSVKKPIMIVIIVVCLGVAGLVLFKGGSGGGGADSIPASETVWVKCNNPACKVGYEANKKEYYKELEANVNPNPMAQGSTAVTCKECDKRSLFFAHKCPNADCGTIFIDGSSGPNDFGDRCPECKRSEVEDRGKRRLAGDE